MKTPSPLLVNAGRVMFALGLIGLAILGFMTNDLIVGRPPVWPPSFGGKETFSLVLNVLLVAACVAIIFQRQGAFAALLTAAIIFTFSFLIRYIPAIVKADPKEILWNINAYKTLALIGGSLIVAVYFLIIPYWFEESRKLTTTEKNPKELKANSTAQTIFLKGHLPILAIVL